ncbi:myosin-13-like [Actinia tenebrosa]|uniref:Myosin-13-like n=1 Tax=Actinia tenebrosa TaxID=6105 RepID=A0A6P8IY36_ACTTE|nr:myosin-13-like [Actinia tenebrosa]
MATEGTTDFDPTTEEGQVDINDEEYETLLPDDNVDKQGLFDKLTRKYGRRARDAMRSLRDKFKSKNPHTPIPEYLQMESLGVRSDLTADLIKDLRERYPSLNLAPLDFQIGDKGQVQVRESGRKKWHNLYQRKNSHLLNNQLPKGVTNALGTPNLTMLSTSTQKETEVAQRAFIRGVSRPGYKVALRSAIRLQEECKEKLNQLEVVEEEKSKQLEELPSNSDATGGLMSHLRRISAEKEALKKEIQENNITIDDLTRQLDAVTKDEGGITKLLDDFKEDNIALQSRIEELEEEFIKQNRLTTASHTAEIADFKARLSKLLEEKSSVRNQLKIAVNEAAGKDVELQRLGKELMESVDRERQVMVDKAVAGEQIRQLQQAVEDLEYEIDRQRVIIEDQTRPEEEREAAKREIEALQERLVELQTQIEGKEKELGLTTKEKVKRALLKYGIPLAFAVAISSVVGVILSALKATGAGVKKLGSGLTDLGKKMAAGLPGLLGSVVSLALRAGGELLKFVGNNIWILVVAIGVVLLKKMKS